MALFPCEIGEERYRGKQAAIYPAIVNGVNSERTKIRGCGPHLEDLLSRLPGGVAEVDPDDPAGLAGRSSDHCDWCGEDEETPYSTFITAYLPGEERRDWYGRVCAGCVDAARLFLRLA